MRKENNRKLREYFEKNGRNLPYSVLAERFNVTEGAARGVYERFKNSLLMKSIKSSISDNAETSHYITSLEDTIVSIVEDLEKGIQEKTASTSEEVKSLDDLIRVCNIDTETWNIDKYIQNKWGENYQVKAFLSKKTSEQEYTQEFISFLETYKPKQLPSKGIKSNKRDPKAYIILDPQDQHLDKYDEGGDNDLMERFQRIYDIIDNTILKASRSYKLDKVTYVLGSDMFNSEWTGMTVKGTPQTNIVSYQEGFEKICNFQISVINLLAASFSEVDVMYIPGNHDEYVGWHLIHFLESYYRESRVQFDTGIQYTKYRRYNNTAIQFNHGDAIKPADLVNIFPVDFKEQWGKCDHFISLIGDKHHNHYKDFNGIEFHQLPSLSNSKSKWDLKKGFTGNKGSTKIFVIVEDRGIEDIYTPKL